LEIYNNAFYQNNINNNAGCGYIRINNTEGIKLSNNAYYGDNIVLNWDKQQISIPAWGSYEKTFFSGKSNILDKNNRSLLKGKGLNLKKINASFNAGPGINEKKEWNIGAYIK
ncbi:MAG: hypothetical protein Q8903_02100, partial [Bacteroidota bacterium]|nr:hypothetical protein [Bacteroidota bacterium]